MIKVEEKMRLMTIIEITSRPRDECSASAAYKIGTAGKIKPSNGSQRCPESFALPAAVDLMLRLLGQDPGERLVGESAFPWTLSLGYLHGMGASGDIFDLPLFSEGFDPEKAVFMLRDAGFLARWIERRERLRESICAALCRDRPVLLVWKDGLSPMCVVTGFREGGSVLEGWDWNWRGAEVMDFPGWEKNAVGAVVIEGNAGRPDPRMSTRQILQRGLKILERNQGRHEAWIDCIEKDVSGARAALSQTAEARWYGAHFMIDAAECLPEAEAALFVAALCCEREHELMWKIKSLVRKGGGMDELAQALRQAGKIYAELALRVEEACRGESASN